MIDLAGVIVLVLLVMGLTLGAVYIGWFIAQGGEGAKEFGRSWDQHQDDQDEDTGEQVDLPALKINPEDPPTWKRYSPPAGKQPPFCNCHGRPIRQGENILMWPDPEDPGAYRLFHKDFVDSLGADLA